MKKPVFSIFLIVSLLFLGAAVWLLEESDGDSGSTEKDLYSKTDKRESSQAQSDTDAENSAKTTAEGQRSVERAGDSEERSAENAGGQSAGPLAGASASSHPGGATKAFTLGSVLGAERRPEWVPEAFWEADITELETVSRLSIKSRDAFGYPLTDAERREVLNRSLWIEQISREQIEARAEAEDLEISWVTPEGVGYYLEGFREGEPAYTRTLNAAAAEASGAAFVRRSADFDPTYGPEIDGSGFVVNVNDHGTIHFSSEFENDAGRTRILFVEENDEGSRSHMTHVAGTIAARGNKPEAIGMAPEVLVRSLVQQTPTDITRFGMTYPNEPWQSVMGNTSLGSASDNYGMYTGGSANFDRVLRDAPYYLHFYAASNEGSSYQTLSQDKPVAKNVVTVGSTKGVTRDEQGNYVSGGSLSSFSSRGPTMDGRIKPDLVTKGESLYSPKSETGYGTKRGTSMASPNAAGGSVLLIDYFSKRFGGQLMRATTTKALMIHTAYDLDNPGPDYKNGWGLLDIQAAGKVIRGYADEPTDRVLREDRLFPDAPEDARSYTYESDGGGDVRVTLVWDDAQGQSQWDSTSTESVLRNNLHLRVIDADGVTRHPYVMPYVTGTDTKDPFDSDLITADAVTGVNDTDNVLQVYLADAPEGTYTVEVDYTGELYEGWEQPFSLVVTGLESDEGASTPSIASFEADPGMGSDLSFALSGSGFMLGTQVFLRRPDSGEVPLPKATVFPDEITGRLNALDLDPGYWDVVVRNPDGEQSVLGNAYFVPLRQSLFATDFSDAAGFTLGEAFDGEGASIGSWAVHEPTALEPYGAAVGTQVLSSHPDGDFADFDGTFYAESPVIDLSGTTDAMVSFQRWLGIATSYYTDAELEWRVSGGSWQALWASETFSPTIDNGWKPKSYALPPEADGQEVQIRFGFRTNNATSISSVVQTGWHIDDFEVTGIPDDLSEPPAITSSPILSASAGQAYSYTLTGSDANDPAEALSWSAVDLPAWLTLEDHGDGTATLSGTPDGEDAGTPLIQVGLSNSTYTTWQNFELEVTSPLQFGGVPAFTGDPGSSEATVSATQDQGQAISLTAVTLPGWLSFADNGDGTGTLSQQAFTGDDGARDVVIEADDGDITTRLDFVAYRQMEDRVLTLTPHEGSELVLLTADPDLDEVRIDQIIEKLEAGWDYYAQSTGQTPSLYYQYNGLPTIAEVPDGTTCGAGCGFLGATGIELTQSAFTDLYEGVRDHNEYDQAAFYEMGRNFWFYGDELSYHSPDDPSVISTGYAVFMRFQAMQAAGVAGGPFNGNAFADFEAEVRSLLDTYLADGSKTWDNTLKTGQGVANDMGLGATDLFASFLFRLADVYGTAIPDTLWQEAGTLAAASDTSEAVDNLIRAASAVTGENLAPLFSYWRWPVSTALESELDADYPSSDPGAFRWNTSLEEVDGEVGSVSFQVERAGGDAGEVSVAYATQGDSASAGTHYVSESGELTWAHGETGSKTVSVDIIDAGPIGQTVEFNLVLSDPTDGAVLDSPGEATVRVVYEAEPLPDLAAPVVDAVTHATAELSVDLLQGGETNALRAFWGLSDGGSDPGAWDQQVDLGSLPPGGSADLSLSGLTEETPYFVRFEAENTTGSTTQTDTVTFTTDPLPDYTAFDLSFPGVPTDETLSNFPLLVRLSSSLNGFAYESMAYPETGTDLRFYDEGGSELPFRIESWDPDGESTVWVGVPSLSDATKVTLQIGDPTHDSFPSYTTDGSVWANAPYVSVWNLDEADGATRQDVKSGLDADSVGNVLQVPGIVGAAAAFDGSDGDTRLQAGTNLAPEHQFTTSFHIEGWMWINTGADTQKRELVSQEDTYWGGRGYRLGFNGTRARVAIGVEAGASGGDGRITEDVDYPGGVPEGEWFHVATSWENGSIRTYFNGELVQESAFDHTIDYETSDNQPLVLGAGWFGDNPTQNRSLDGNLDEVRVGSEALSGAWITSTYRNIAESDSFMAVAPGYAEDLPLFVSEPVTAAVVAEPYSYLIEIDGGDASQLTVTADSLPAWLSLSPTDEPREFLLSGTPATGDEDTVEIQLTADDGANQTAQTFSLVVFPEGTQPGIPEIVLEPVGTVTPNSARVGADLLAGDAPVTVGVWYGLTDGGSDSAAWDQSIDLGTTEIGAVETLLSELAEESTYFYRFVAENTVDTVQTDTGSFTTPKDLSGIQPVITLDRPTVESVQIPDDVGLILETTVTETGGDSGSLSLEWTMQSGPSTVTWDQTDQADTAAWFEVAGDYVLRLTADNGVNSDSVDIAVRVGDPSLITGAESGQAEEENEELLLLVDFSAVDTIGGYEPPNDGSAPQHPNADGNGHYWNTIHHNVLGGNNTSTNLQTSDGGSSGISLFMNDGIGSPTSSDHWTGADPARAELPAWVPSDVASANNPLDDRANISNDVGIFTLSGLPSLDQGESYRIEVVSATIFDGAGDAEPGRFNLEAANSTGGNASGNDVGSIVPTNGLTGDALVWGENTNSDADRFGFGFNSRTDVDMGADIPNQGWIVWDGVEADNGEISIHASAFGDNPRAPVNALAVYIVTEGNQNVGPLVDAGADQTVEADTESSLAGTVDDDGLPETPGAVTTEWIQRSGPTATLGDPTLLTSSFTAADTGEAVLRLIAFDGEVATADETTVVVEAGDTPPSPEPGEVAFDPSSHSFSEDAGTVQVPVSRGGGSDGEVSVRVTHQNGGATAGEQFEAVDQVLTWADGETGARQVDLTILPQPAQVGDLDFELVLSDPTGDVTVGSPGTATVTLEGPGEAVMIDFDVHDSYGAINVTTETDGSKTLDITASGDADPWDTAFRWPVDEPLLNGEILWLRIVGRASSVPGEETGEMSVPTMVELQNSPYTRYLNGSMRFGPQSGEQILIGEMTEDLAADAAFINLQFGGLEGTLHIESVELVRYPPGTDPDDLPRSPIVWEGMEPDAPWRSQAEADILTHRTDDLRIRVLDADGNPVSGATVTASQKNHAFAFGTAVNNRPMLDPDFAEGPTYRQKLVENFEWATPENSLKWQAEDWNSWEAGKTTADQGQATVDKIVDLGLIPRGHVLLWPSYDNSPDALQGLDNAALATEIENRVRTMSTQYAGVIPEWDALNEIFSNHDFPDLLGDQLLEDVFTWAREEDPDARFFINDFNILSNGNLNTDHKDFYYNLINDLQTSGVPLGGIGMQGHFGGTMPGVSDMQATLDRFASFGLPIRVTEYDHDISDEEAQAGYLRDVLTLTFAHPAADGFFVWGFWDGRHWKDNAPFYREDWSEKPALAVWQNLVYQEWWTGELTLETDAEGWATVPAAYHGDYEIDVDGYDRVTFSHRASQNEIVLTPPDPYEQWLEAHNLDPESDTVIKAGRELSPEEAYLLSDDPEDPNDFLRVTEMVTQPEGNPDMLRLHFPSLENRQYQVEYTDDLSSDTWTLEATIITGDGQSRYFDVPMGTDNPKRFYRIRVSFP
ncbi:MAG: DUF2341 domain-containing protein [Opitutales bacterium]